MKIKKALELVSLYVFKYVDLHIAGIIPSTAPLAKQQESNRF